MGLLNSIKKKVVKTVKNITGVSDKEKDARRKAEQQAAEAVKLASAGANEDVRKKMAEMRNAVRSRKKQTARGRDSTIITQGSEIQSRTLLG